MQKLNLNKINKKKEKSPRSLYTADPVQQLNSKEAHTFIGSTMIKDQVKGYIKTKLKQQLNSIVHR